MKSATRAIFAEVVLNAYIASAFGNTVDSESAPLYPVIVSLTLILGAAAAATWFLRRWKGSIGRHGGPMKLLHVIALGPRERLALVKVADRYLVVGVTPSGISKVAELDDIPVEIPEPAADDPTHLAQASQ
jgi:flagellar protein FliO/FliZ